VVSGNHGLATFGGGRPDQLLKISLANLATTLFRSKLLRENIFMNIRSSLVIATIVVVALLSGCSAAIRNISDTPVEANRPVTQEDVQKAIVRAGVILGWQMKLVKSGLIEGTLNLRGNMAKVDINYDTKAYSITYKDSSGLNYDGSTIHKNYNGWIENLDSRIRVQLSSL
jgi:hypothetical protein